MVTMNISLPDNLRDFIEHEVAAGGYDTASAYFHDILQEIQKRKAQEHLEALLQAGWDSESITATPEWWQQFRGELLAQHQQKQNL